MSAKIILGVARRCSYGVPQVLLCAPEKKALPFPTTFWLVCPHLVREAGRLESLNGVSLMESEMEGRRGEWIWYSLSHAALRLSLMSAVRKNFLRRYARRRFDAIRRGGVGGIADGSRRIKCLHLQFASYLGIGYHPASYWMDGRINGWECADGRDCVP